MSRFFVSPDCAEGWKAGLARADHWKPGFSAHSLAHTWHEADGFPVSVAAALGASELGPLEFIAGIPEYKVALPGGDTASQTDLFILARTQRQETVAIAVEGKAVEAFGDSTVAEWRVGASAGKQERLRHLLKVLGLTDDQTLSGQRYQLLHRVASVLLEAARLNARHSLMLVHSFGGLNKWHGEFLSFAALLGATPRIGDVVRAPAAPASLFLGWVSDPHPGMPA